MSGTLLTSPALVPCIGFLLLWWYIRYTQTRPLRNIRGPPCPSFFLGHSLALQHQPQAAEIEYQWVQEYGEVLKFYGCYGEEVLMLADPKALHHVLHVSGYNYPKKKDVLQSIRLFMGKGIFWASGDTHKRHKKVMTPAFEANRLRSFVPIFQRSAEQLSEKWREEIKMAGNVLNVAKTLSNVTLDNIGIAAFDYHFNALEGGGDGDLSKAFENLFAESMLSPPKSTILFTGLWRFIHPEILRFVEYLPVQQLQRLRHFLKVSQCTAKSVIEEKSSDGAVTDDHKDILSILVKANSSQDPKRRLDEDEILAQMATVMLAGHDSTASSLSWLFLDLAKHPEDQRRIRAEIASVRTRSQTPDNLSVADLDAMTYTIAVIKESLRLNPIAFMIPRESGKADVIPLSKPIRAQNGEAITEVPVPKGQSIYVNIFTYNRLPSVWGLDANEWNPSRFLGPPKDKQIPMGLYGNMLTFSGGVRGCMGWRFAVLEMQAILIGMIENFEFAPPPEDVEILRAPAGSMIPVVKGCEHEGTQLPLRIYPIDKVEQAN